jgi:hypothetical protein
MSLRYSPLSLFTPFSHASRSSVWRRLGRQLAVWVVGAGALLAAGAALADPPGRVGRVAETEGTVWTADEQRGEWVHAQRNSPITDRDRVSVSPGSRAVIQIGSATLRLDGDTELEVLQLDDRNVRLQLHGGSAALQLPMQDSAREFEIVTAEGRFMPRQRGHYRVDRRAGTSMLTVWDGALRFESEDSELDVREGQRVDFWSERGRTHYATATLDRDAFTDWVVASERRYGQLAQRHVSPEMTGAYDLDQYGAWDTHPQYGAVWYPRTVASDWAPYRYGRWSYVNPWGWTWVDDAPWGFAPFHYGRWVNWRGRWCWTPGGYVARPVYAPALVAWFGGPNVSVGVGGAPHVGWVALSPFEVFAPWYAVSHVHLTYINVNPWQHMHGYHNHRHDDYANRHVNGAVVVVPQSVVVERRPVRQDVITPGQASIWRGDRPPPAGSTNGVAIRIPPPPQPGNTGNAGNTTKTVGRSEAAFVPPAPVKTAAVMPPPKTPNGRDVPWVRGGRSGEQGAAPIVAPAPGAAPNVATAPVRSEPRNEPLSGGVRGVPPGGKTWRDGPPDAAVPSRPVEPRAADPRPAREARDVGMAAPVQVPRAGEGRAISVPQHQPQVVQPRTFPRDEDDRGGHRMPPPNVQRAPPVQAPAPVVVAPPAQQVQIQRPPMQQAQPMPQHMPQPQVMQPRPRPQDRDRDDDRGNAQRRGGPKDERGGMMIK